MDDASHVAFIEVQGPDFTDLYSVDNPGNVQLRDPADKRARTPPRRTADPSRPPRRPHVTSAHPPPAPPLSLPATRPPFPSISSLGSCAAYVPPSNFLPPPPPEFRVQRTSSRTLPPEFLLPITPRGQSEPSDQKTV
jgi:hypothetical protein